MKRLGISVYPNHTEIDEIVDIFIWQENMALKEFLHVYYLWRIRM